MGAGLSFHMPDLPVRRTPHRPWCNMVFTTLASIRCAALCLALVAGGAQAMAPKKSAAQPAPAAPASASQPRSPHQSDPDSLLIAVYQELAAQRLRSAMEKADALVAAYPHFHLGHLIRGDLLLMQTQPVTAMGAAPAANAIRLQELRQEAAVRLRALRERPDPALVPHVLLQLRPDQKVAFVVDARRSRLFVYENQGGKPRLVTDYYVSQGKLGVHKLREGDQKTPLGVYYVTGRLNGQKLPDFYGPGALPLSYPNEWDRLHGRGGSGIWLHGTPSDSFSRPPLSSDGCVVLTNPDLTRLSRSAEVGKTPVVIADEVRFLPPERAEAERARAWALAEAWRRDMESRDPARMRSHYSARFKVELGDLDAWLDRHQKWLGKYPQAQVALRDVSLFAYPGESELIVATFTEDTLVKGRIAQTQRLRQYWAREGREWRIVTENSWQ